MHLRWIIIGLLGVAFPSSLIAQAVEKPLKERIAEIVRDNEAREKIFQEEVKAAGRDADKVERANKDFNADRRKRVGAVKALVLEYRDAPAAFDGILAIVVRMHWLLDKELTEIASRHLSDPRAGELCVRVRYLSDEPWAESLIGQAAETHPIREVRGQATLALGDYYRISAFPRGRTLPDSEVASFLDRASKAYAEASKTYALVPTLDGKAKIGERAELELTRIRNLPNLKVGKPAPEISGEGIDGKSFKLSDYRGKVVVVVFWGSWCAPCMAMVPHERELRERLKDKPFALLGVNGGDTREIARETREKHQMDWPSWWDGEEMGGPIETAYDVKRWPTIYVIDPKGAIRDIGVRGKKLDQAVDDSWPELAENPGPSGH